jgi:hypothetical protein
MTDDLDPLTFDFLAWLSAGARPYAEVMDAWRTSCPRLTIWEDAVDRGLVVRRRGEDATPVVEITARGRVALEARGPAPRL